MPSRIILYSQTLKHIVIFFPALYIYVICWTAKKKATNKVEPQGRCGTIVPTEKLVGRLLTNLPVVGNVGLVSKYNVMLLYVLGYDILIPHRSPSTIASLHCVHAQPVLIKPPWLATNTHTHTH